VDEKQAGYQPSEEEINKIEEVTTNKEVEDKEKSGNFEVLFPQLAWEIWADRKNNLETSRNRLETNLKIENMMREFIDTDSLNSSLKELRSMSPEEIGEKRRAASSEIVQALLANKDHLTETREEKAGKRLRKLDTKSYEYRFDSLQKNFRDGKCTIEVSFLNKHVSSFQYITNYSEEQHYEVLENNPMITLRDEEDSLRKNGFLYFEEVVEIADQLSPEAKHLVDLLIAGAFAEYLEYRKGKAQDEIATLQAVFNNKSAKEKSILDVTDSLLQRSGVESDENLA